MVAYYNEIDPYCCQWLKNLIAEGLIAPGDVDERSIAEVQPGELRGYTQCHFFAGIAGWSLALRLAGWPDERPVWTGSCPCQPFSAAGKQQGTQDDRHLWPEFRRLIAECAPATVFGEQVASKLGRAWLSAVRSEMEALGYGVGAADLCAAGVGAPHIRQRLWFVANAEGSRRGMGIAEDERPTEGKGDAFTNAGYMSGELADTDGGHASTEGLQRGGKHGCEQEDGRAIAVADSLPAGRPEGWPEPGNRQTASGGGSDFGMADSEHAERRPEHQIVRNAHGRNGFGGSGDLEQLADFNRDPSKQGRSTIEYRERDASSRKRSLSELGRCSMSSPWSDLIWLPCTDGKQRPTQPGIFPLAHGVPARVAKLRAAGNAIAPQVAAAFITAAMLKPEISD